MAHNPIIGRYRLYKEGTNKLVAWMAKTASRCCDVSNIVTSITAAAKLHGTSASIKVRTRELIALARAIANARSPIELPASVLQICADVIAGLGSCAEWYAAQAIQDDTKLAEQNRTHAFFIDTLRMVHEILSSCKQAEMPGKPANATKASKKKAKAATSELENLFAHLEVEEPSMSPLREEGSKSDSASQACHMLAKAETNLEQEGDDQALAIWCLLQDLNDVRKFVVDTWSEFARGETSLMAAVIVTDTAFGLTRRANEEFERSWPSLKNWWDLESFLDIRMALMGNVVWMVLAKKGALPKTASSTLNPAELLCPPGAFLLRYYRNNARMLMTAIGNIHKSHVLDDKMYMLPPVPGFEQALLQTVLEIPIFANLREEYGPRRQRPVKGMEDEYADGLIDYCIGDHVPIWLVVATQTCMEIYDIIHTNPKCGADAYRATTEQHRDILQQSRTFYASFNDHFLQRTWHDELKRSSRPTNVSLRLWRRAVMKRTSYSS